MHSRIVYFIALLFLVHNLCLLWEDSYSVSYQSVIEGLIEDPFNFSVCLPLKKLGKHTEDGKKVYDFELTGFVNSTSFIDKLFRQIEAFLVEKFKEERVGDFLKRDQCYLFKKHLCFLVSEHHLNVVFAFRDLRYKILAVSNISKSFFFNSVHWNENERSYLTHVKIYKMIVKNGNNPFSDCVKQRVAGQPPYSKFNCINECLKRNDNKFTYYYEREGGELIDLDYSERDKRQEELCYKECKRESCFLEYILAVNAIKNYNSDSDLSTGEKRIRTPNPALSTEYSNLEVYPTIKLTDFYLQFIGLISLFFDLNVIETLPGLVRFVAANCPPLQANARWNEKFQRFYPKFKLLLLISSVYALIAISLHIWHSYLADLERPINSQLTLYSTEIHSFSLYLCYPVRELMGKTPPNKQERWDKQIDEQIMANHTFEQIENLTNSMPAVRTFLKYGSLERDVEFEISEKVFFRNTLFFEADIEMFTRCFLMNVENLREERYRSLFTNTKLVLETRWPFALYITGLRRNLDADAYLYKGRFRMNKLVASRLKSSKLFNCTNYSGHFEGCDSQKSCLNRCILDAYLRKHHKFPVMNQTVLIKEQFDGYLLKHTHFGGEDDANITAACHQKFYRRDCEAELYWESYKTWANLPNQTQIDLFFEIEIDRDIRPSCEKTIFAILNVESILLGRNATKLLLTALAFIRITFKTKWYDWFKPLVFLFCFAGFLVHLYVIFRSLIDGELLENGYFKKNEFIRFPDLIFCFKFNPEELDPNHRLTGEYLDRWVNLTFSKVFEKISYLDQNGQTIAVTQFTNTPHSELSYSAFFLQNMKCFQIDVALVYEEKTFLFLEDPFALKFWLRRNLTTNDRTVYFTCKHHRSKQLNMMNPFKFGSDRRKFKKSKFQIKLELLRTVYNEAKLFEYLRNPWSLLLGSRDISDATVYFDGMASQFKQLFNSTTKLMVLDRDFELELDDQLFLQYFAQIQNVSDFYYPISNNTQQYFYHKYIQEVQIGQIDPSPLRQVYGHTV